MSIKIKLIEVSIFLYWHQPMKTLLADTWVLPFYFYFLIWACKFLSILAYHKTLPDLICLAWPQLLTSNLAWLGILACQASKIVLNYFFFVKMATIFFIKTSLHMCKNYGRKRKKYQKKKKWKELIKKINGKTYGVLLIHWKFVNMYLYKQWLGGNFHLSSNNNNSWVILFFSSAY